MCVVLCGIDSLSGITSYCAKFWFMLLAIMWSTSYTKMSCLERAKKKLLESYIGFLIWYAKNVKAMHEKVIHMKILMCYVELILYIKK